MKRKICLVEFLHSQEADGICSLPHRVDLDVDEQLSLTSFLASKSNAHWDKYYDDNMDFPKLL